MRRGLICSLAAAALATALTSVAASAHALLVRSEPESNADLVSAPPTIELWFSEPLEPAFSSARVVEPTGTDVPAGGIVFDPADPTHMTLLLEELGPGIYTVAWQTLSRVDGHEWFGSFPFTVLNPDGSRPGSQAAAVSQGDRSETPTAGETAARWLTLTGSMVLFGALIFDGLVIPAVRFPALASESRRLIGWAVWAAVAGTLIGGGATVLLQAGRLGGLPALPRFMLETRTGALVLARIAFSAAALNVGQSLAPSDRSARGAAVLDIASFTAVVAALALLGNSGEPAIPVGSSLVIAASLVWIAGPWHREPAARQRKGRAALAILALANLLSFSLSSHAGAVEGSVFAVAADALHLLAASAWIAGLGMLPVLWRRSGSGPGRGEFFPAVRRFSTLAAASVYLLVLTGTFSALVQLPSLRALVETAYGRVLLVKLAVFCLALALAYLNNRAARGTGSPRALPRRIAVESGLSAAILIAVAVLVQTPPPRSVAAPVTPPDLGFPFIGIKSAGDLNLHLQVEPNRAGRNRFWVHLFHSDGSSIGEVQLVRLQMEDAAQQLGRSVLDLEPLGPGTFAAEGANLSQAGQWSVEVYVRRRGVDDLLVPFAIDVSAQATAARPPAHFGHPVPGMPPLVLLGGVLLSAGLVPFLWGNDLRVLARESYTTWLILGGATGLVGVVALGFGLVTAAPPGPPAIPDLSPIPASPESLARGEAVYAEGCAVCHGPEGRGDGPVGITLNPRPANLWIHMQRGVHSDGQLFEWVTNGFPNSAMPAFRDDYSEEDRWHVINFIRTFAERTTP